MTNAWFQLGDKPLFCLALYSLHNPFSVIIPFNLSSVSGPTLLCPFYSRSYTQTGTRLSPTASEATPCSSHISILQSEIVHCEVLPGVIWAFRWERSYWEEGDNSESFPFFLLSISCYLYGGSGC